MSMIAKFARVTPWRLKEIIADPDLATKVFDESEAAPGTPHPVASGASMIPPASAEIIRRASAALATSMASMNPEMQSRVQQAFGNLGIDPASLAGGEGGEKLLELLRQRARSMNTRLQSSLDGSVGGSPSSPPASAISLDKAWHAIHYLLCGSPDSGVGMLSQVVMGGTEVGEDLGYGPARYFEPKLVLDIVGELTRAGLEAEMQERFDPAQMTNEKIYPFQWNAADLTWVMDGFHRLRQLFADAGAAHEAVLTVIE